MPKLSSLMRVVRVQYSKSRTGQYHITIPKEIIKQFGLKKGSLLTIVDDEDCIKLIPTEKVKEKLLR